MLPDRRINLAKESPEFAPLLEIGGAKHKYRVQFTSISYSVERDDVHAHVWVKLAKERRTSGSGVAKALRLLGFRETPAWSFLTSCVNPLARTPGHFQDHIRSKAINEGIVLDDDLIDAICAQAMAWFKAEISRAETEISSAPRVVRSAA